MSTEQTIQELSAKARAHKLHQESVDPKKSVECEFLSCEEKAVLYVEGFYVCLQHGFRLIQCLTEKLDFDKVEPDKTEEDNV